MKMTPRPSALCRATVFCACVLAFSVQIHAANSTWTLNGNGTFSTPGNWSAGVPGATTGNASTDVATFNRTTFAAGAGVVTLDTGYNLAGVTINATGTGNNITVGNTAANSLTLSAGGVIQNIGSTASATTFNAPLILAGNASILNTNSAGGTLSFGLSGGVRSITAAAGSGSVAVTLGGTSTANNVAYATFSQGTGSTLGIIKDGAGFWQLNNIGGNMTGGFLVRNGSLSFGNNAAASLGTITLGDAGTTSGNLTLGGGSSLSIGGSIVVASSSAANVIFQRTGGSGATTFSGNISMSRDIVVRHGAASNQALNMSGNITGTGNLSVTSVLASTSNITFSQSVNMAGRITNNSTAGTGQVVFNGAIGSSVAGLTQNSASVNMTLSNASNAYTGNTTITAGTLFISGGGNLGDSNLIMNGGRFDITGATTGLTLASTRSLTGSGTIVTTGKSFIVDGTLSPGNSPGLLNITGNMTIGANATTTMELAGSGGVKGTDFDNIAVTETLTYGGALSIASFGGFSLDTIGNYDLFDATVAFSGNFASISVGATSLAHSSGVWTGDNGVSVYTFTNSTGVLGITAIPEPGTLGLLAAAAGLVVLRRRKRS